MYYLLCINIPTIMSRIKQSYQSFYETLDSKPFVQMRMLNVKEAKQNSQGHRHSTVSTVVLFLQF